MKKKAFYLVLALVLLVNVFCVQVFAGDNLALKKPVMVWFPDGNEGITHDAAPAEFAVDGLIDDNGNRAQANLSFAWGLQVDLEKIYTVDKVRVMFSEECYATDYEILISDTPEYSDYKVVKTMSGGIGAQWIDIALDPVAARYIMINAIKPDGPDQAGLQMGILEFEVYGQEKTGSASAAEKKTTSNNPKTGDVSTLGFIVMAAISGLGAVGMKKKVR